MKDKRYSLNTLWDRRALNQDTQLSRIMLTVKIQGEAPFKIALRLKSTEADYVKAISTKMQVSEEVKSIRKDINDNQHKAETILDKYEKRLKLYSKKSNYLLLNDLLLVSIY